MKYGRNFGTKCVSGFLSLSRPSPRRALTSIALLILPFLHSIFGISGKSCNSGAGGALKGPIPGETNQGSTGNRSINS
jgi:hypothetical protein